MSASYAVSCPFCKGDIEHRDDIYYCKECGKGFSPHQMQLLITNGKLEEPEILSKGAAARKITLWIISGLIVAAVLWVTVSWMLMLLLSPVIVAVVRENCKKIIAAGKRERIKPYYGPETIEDYIAVFRNMHAKAPACSFAGEAAYQLRQFQERKRALHFLMGSEEHPFRDAENEAEVYMLANCKRLYVRLQCCNLRLPSEIAAYDADFQQCLNDNAVVLRDFERLTYEVSKLDEGSAPQAPALGVLADALHDVRTGQRELPQRRIS